MTRRNPASRRPLARGGHPTEDRPRAGLVSLVLLALLGPAACSSQLAGGPLDDGGLSEYRGHDSDGKGKGCPCNGRTPKYCECRPDSGAVPSADLAAPAADLGAPGADLATVKRDSGVATDTTRPPTADSSAPPPGGTTPLWHADADSNGMAAWKNQQEAYPDRLDLVTDPEGRFGKVYQAKLVDGDRYTDGKARCELYGSVLPNGTYFKYVEGDDLYFGWRTRINAGIAFRSSGNGGNLTQFKGDSSCGGPAIGLTFYDGKVSVRSELYGVMWYGPSVPAFAGAWHDLVFHIKFSKSQSVGFVELWLDGVRQTFKDGSTQYRMPTMCPGDAYVYLKMGLYRSSELTGTAYHWIESPRIGTSFASVVPR